MGKRRYGRGSSPGGREVLRVAGDDAEKERRRSSGWRAAAKMGGSGTG
jgi:hypothetical protein